MVDRNPRALELRGCIAWVGEGARDRSMYLPSIAVIDSTPPKSRTGRSLMTFNLSEERAASELMDKPRERERTSDSNLYGIFEVVRPPRNGDRVGNGVGFE